MVSDISQYDYDRLKQEYEKEISKLKRIIINREYYIKFIEEKKLKCPDWKIEGDKFDDAEDRRSLNEHRRPVISGK